MEEKGSGHPGHLATVNSMPTRKLISVTCSNDEQVSKQKRASRRAVASYGYALMLILTLSTLFCNSAAAAGVPSSPAAAATTTSWCRAVLHKTPEKLVDRTCTVAKISVHHLPIRIFRAIQSTHQSMLGLANGYYSSRLASGTDLSLNLASHHPRGSPTMRCGGQGAEVRGPDLLQYSRLQPSFSHSQGQPALLESRCEWGRCYLHR